MFDNDYYWDKYDIYSDHQRGKALEEEFKKLDPIYRDDDVPSEEEEIDLCDIMCGLEEEDTDGV